MITFKVIDKRTGNPVDPETVTNRAGAFFVLSEVGELFVCYLDSWHDYEMILMDMEDHLEVVIDGEA